MTTWRPSNPSRRAAAARRRPPSLAWLFGLALGCLNCAGSAARAEVVACVSTVAELSQQFLLAQVSNQDLVLKVVQGVYDLEGSALVTPAFLFPQSVRVLGGYAAGCASRVVNPQDTVFFSNGAERINWRSRGRLIEIEGIRFAGRGTQIYLSPVPRSEVDFAVTLRRNIFDSYGLVSGNDDARVEINYFAHEGSSRRVRVENNLFHHNRASAVLGIIGYDDDFVPLAVDVSVVNNTFFSNAGSISGICVQSLAFPTLANNIVLGHEFDLDSRCVVLSDAAPMRLYNNTFDTRRLGPPLLEVASSTSTPMFVDLANFNYRLRPESPAVNSGSAAAIIALPGLDLEGNPRFQGLAPDRGAYENANTGTLVQTVVNTNDSGAGSLRQAIINANGTPGLNLIFFDIPGSCPRTINLASALPTLTESVRIDGFTQPGSSRNDAPAADNATRCVIVRPAVAGAIPRGLYSQSLLGSGIQLGVDGLAMGGFGSSAIEVVGGGAHYVQGSQFGGSVGGVALPANATSILLGASDGGRIGGPDDAQRNVIGGATVAGVALELAFENSITNNLIGLVPGGQAALPNAIGIRLNAASRNRITDNVISGNGNGIVALSPSGFSSQDNLVGGNLIGLRAVPLLGPNGSALGNEFNGVLIYGERNVVGECVYAENGQSVVGSVANTIAYNGTTTGSVGVNIRGGRGNCIAGNRVFGNGSDADAQQVDVGTLGIDPVDNDSAAGSDSLSNRGINAPTLLSASGGATQGSAVIRLQSRNGIYRVLVYSGTRCSTSNGQGEARDLHAVANVSIVNAAVGTDGFSQFTVPLRSVGTQGSLSGRGFVTQVQRSPNPVTEPTDSSELGSCVTYVSDGSLFGNGFE